MNINFKDVCGNSLMVQLPLESKVSDACQILSQKLGYQLLLISPNDDQNYYPNDYSMTNVLNENPDFIMFTKYTKVIQNVENKIKESPISTNLRLSLFSKQNLKYFNYPSLNLVSNATKNLYIILRLYNRSHPNHILHQQYKFALNNIPSDFQDRVNQIAELGFLIEDIKSALRLSNYNVQKATDMIIFQNSNKNDQNLLNFNQTSMFNNFRFTGNRNFSFYRSNIQNKNQNLNTSEKVDIKSTFSFKPFQQQNKNDQVPFKFSFQLLQNQPCQSETTFSLQPKTDSQFSLNFHHQRSNLTLQNSTQLQQPSVGQQTDQFYVF